MGDGIIWVHFDDSFEVATNGGLPERHEEISAYDVPERHAAIPVYQWDVPERHAEIPD